MLQAKRLFDVCKKCDQTFAFDAWKEVEREFGDRFHAHGLSGVLEIAQPAFQDKPFALFFLAKVFLCFSERVPWEILICNNSSNYSLRSLIWVDKFQRELFSQLTEIADWLFSPQGKEVLDCCRNDLEELGIIS